ncbi:hypothetical protein RQP53_23980 [Paucibacter sp. APW11]|uniref:Uncharacterized protein n=1 Tax=Roseateles aquae TaxID=3077235 RepID=A0ABU3PJM2_9BURK|nr:hypothetical protein [Paucibacter sp. APW11]MDT9002362.1 hypothetical protein [Paucibacter sp. APW11]
MLACREMPQCFDDGLAVRVSEAPEHPEFAQVGRGGLLALVGQLNAGN